MVDFVAEVRPRSCLSQRNVPILARDDFVTELKSRNFGQSVFKDPGSEGLPLEYPSDLHLKKMLSDMKFSRESITSLLEKSVITLVEKLLTGRAISKIKGSLCISMFSDESPIVANLYQAYPKACSASCLVNESLESNLNIKIKERDIPSLYSPCEKSASPCFPCLEFCREACGSPAEVERSPQSSSGYHSGKDSCFSSPAHDYHSNSPSPGPNTGDSERVQVLDSEASDDKHCQGDEECGDINCQNDESSNPFADSTEVIKRELSPKEKSRSTFNEHFCNGFDEKNTLHIPAASSDSDVITYQLDSDSSASSGDGSDEMDAYDDDDGEDEHRLVIDDTATIKIEETCNVDAKSAVKDWSADNGFSEGNAPGPPLHEHEARQSVTEDDGVRKSPISSDTTDTYSHMNSPEKSQCLADPVPFIPHPQSIVSKHPRGFKCKQCFSILPNTLAVSKHVQSKHNLHCCTHCCRTFTAKNNLKRHVRRHTGQKPYKCSQCPLSFFRGDELKGHVIRHDYSKPFRCSLCKKGYTDRACVKNHMAKEHRSRLIHVCPQCGEGFGEEEAFTAHKSSHPELQQFSCSTCTFIGTNNLMTLKHTLLHGHKLFSCKPCNAHFADPFHYTNHVKKHKKNPSFTQYICCFCNLAFASYDQFVRHEYSHAQGKIHTCTLCKKQFKSRTLLEDHAKTHHQTNPGKSETEQSNVELMETDRDQTLHWKRTDVNQNDIFEEHVNLKSASTGELGKPSYDLDAQNNLLSRLQEVENYEISGQLLDLSMKKRSNPASNEDDSKDDQSNKSNCYSLLRTTWLSVNDDSRNAFVTAEPVNLSQERAVDQRDSASKQSLTVESQDENMYKPINTCRNNKGISDQAFSRNKLPHDILNRSVHAAPKTPNKLSSRLEQSNRAKFSEKTNTELDESSALSERRSWLQTVMNNPSDRLPLRFSPYYKEKMADLAAKFMVARGTKLAVHKGVLGANIPVRGERKPMVIKELDKSQKKELSFGIMPDVQSVTKEGKTGLASQALMDNGEVMHEYSNSETTLRCHIPTIVKSEPMMQQDESADSPLDCRYQKARTEYTDTSSRNGSSHACEICKEVFGSFIELENHSVDFHKRYLCEHCKKSFTARPNRDRHVRYHTGERPYRCDLCDMAFFRGDDLKYHRTTRHPSAQPYVCTRCSASFTWGRDLERHTRHSKCKV